MAYNSFEELDVWKKSCRLSVDIYNLLKGCKDYGLKEQMTRASVSIASNIAKGSAAELRTQTYIAAEIDIISKTEMAEITDELMAVSKMLYSLIKSLNKKP